MKPYENKYNSHLSFSRRFYSWFSETTNCDNKNGKVGIFRDSRKSLCKLFWLVTNTHISLGKWLMLLPLNHVYDISDFQGRSELHVHVLHHHFSGQQHEGISVNFVTSEKLNVAGKRRIQVGQVADNLVDAPVLRIIRHFWSWRRRRRWCRCLELRVSGIGQQDRRLLLKLKIRIREPTDKAGGAAGLLTSGFRLGNRQQAHWIGDWNLRLQGWRKWIIAIGTDGQKPLTLGQFLFLVKFVSVVIHRWLFGWTLRQGLAFWTAGSFQRTRLGIGLVFGPRGTATGPGGCRCRAEKEKKYRKGDKSSTENDCKKNAQDATFQRSMSNNLEKEVRHGFVSSP